MNEDRAIKTSFGGGFKVRKQSRKLGIPRARIMNETISAAL
jgi:hypothetical protein